MSLRLRLLQLLAVSSFALVGCAPNATPATPSEPLYARVDKVYEVCLRDGHTHPNVNATVAEMHEAHRKESTRQRPTVQAVHDARSSSGAQVGPCRQKILAVLDEIEKHEEQEDGAGMTRVR